MRPSKKTAAPHRSKAKPGKTWLYVNIVVAISLIVAGVAALFWVGEQNSAGQVQASAPTFLQQGQPAPDFSLASLEGETVHLSDYAGQVVLVNLWATWCPPCKAEMPTIHDYYLAHRHDGFVVLAVNDQESTAAVREFIQTQGFTFPVLLDQQAQVIEQYQVRGLPTSFIIDRDGVIHAIHTGEISADQLDRLIGPLL